jgi:cobalt-zinc-cadmium resistance protein CzcA
MIKRLVSFSVHQPLFVFLLTGLFLLGGIIAFQNLPIEAFPDVTDIQVTVITLYPGYAAEEVEKQVTTPLEIGLSGLPNAVRMFSHTQFGLSFLIVTFDDRANDSLRANWCLSGSAAWISQTKLRCNWHRFQHQSGNCFVTA